MAHLNVDEILESLSQRIRHYELARRAGDALLEDRNRLELCALVESLLGVHLRTTSEWQTDAWVDSVVDVVVEVTHPGVAVLSGAAVWRGPDGWFLDPLLARFECSSDLASVRAYALQFGDADVGLGHVQYRSNVARSPRPPGQWCFVFHEPG